MMILAATNVWCDFFRAGDKTLSSMLEHDFVATHPLVIGELAVGCLPKREQTIADMRMLTMVKPATFKETHYLLEKNKLYGLGLQWNDLLILASVITTPDMLLWTRDGRLAEVAARFQVAYCPQ